MQLFKCNSFNSIINVINCFLQVSVRPVLLDVLLTYSVLLFYNIKNETLEGGFIDCNIMSSI